MLGAASITSSFAFASAQDADLGPLEGACGGGGERAGALALDGLRAAAGVDAAGAADVRRGGGATAMVEYLVPFAGGLEL